MKLINRQSALGTTACYLDVDATGRTLVVANYSSGSVASLPIGKDGSLGKAATFVQHKGGSVNPTRQSGPHAHCFVLSPDNRYVLSADLGLDQVLSYRLDVDDAKLTIPRQPFVRTPAGAGPRHLTFHPNGRWLYVIHELSNAVSVLDYNKRSGVLIERQTLSTLPADFDGTSHCADVKVTPDGRFVYGTNRGHDSIAIYRVGKSGKLTTVAIVPSLGKGPQNLAITPDGRLLITLEGVCRYRIDAELADKNGYRRVRPDFYSFRADMDAGSPDLDRESFLAVLRRYFDAKQLKVDWASLEQTEDRLLIATLAMMCPFGLPEKQALLEAPDFAAITDVMQSLMTMAIQDTGPSTSTH